MKTRRWMAAIVATTGVLAVPGSSAAAAPDRFENSERLHETWGSCAADDQLLADYTITQAVTVFPSGRATVHLQLVGSVTRTGTGAVGKYAERQRDFFMPDGSERYVGVLSHLVVPGGRGLTLAGQARLDTDGTLSTTPALAPLVVIDFVHTVCEALDVRP